MARYGKKAQQKVKRAMHERKRGKLRSGRSGKKVKSRKQAIAIGLSEARRAGAKGPRKKKSSRKKKKRPRAAAGPFSRGCAATCSTSRSRRSSTPRTANSRMAAES